MASKIFNFENLNDNFKKMINTVRAGSSCSIFGVQNSMRPAIISELGKHILLLTADNLTATSLAEDFSLMGFNSLVLPNISDYFIYKKSSSTDFYKERSKVLFNIVNDNFDIVITPIESLISFLPKKESFKSHIISLKTGLIIEPFELEKKLVEAGYKKEELIVEQGQFSKRGEVFDIFPINSKVPFRIDFFDNEIETIKIFDITSQKGTKQVDAISVCPYSDLFFESSDISNITEQLNKIKNSAKNLTESSLNGEINDNIIFNVQIDEIISRLELGDRGYSLDCISPYLTNFSSSIFDYFDETKDFVVVIDECKQVYDCLENAFNETNARIKELINSNTLVAGKNKCIFDKETVLNHFEKNTCVAFLKITNSNRFFTSKAVFTYKSIPANRYTHNLREFSIDLKQYLLKDYKIYIFAGNDEQVNSVKEVLSTHNISIDVCDFDSFGKKSAIYKIGYKTGFVLPEEKICVIGTYDIFPKKHNANQLKTHRDSIFTIPKIGDYVVHEYHGIGICEGVTKLSGNFGTKDYVVIRYRDNDKLYVPTSQMDSLSRFSGGEAPKKLSKIGGVDFSSVKEKARQSIKKLAFNLVELYATREKIKGYAFSEDNDLQREFENSFPFTETEDQLTSIEEIKADMEKQKTMDRLLCGDVGFGKTEVALRACFKAVMDGKQVAFIAPTTILSEQHYNTAKSRMYDFGVSIEVLNRFKTKQQTEKIIKGIADGSVDLVCGTHRVLSDDVEFKDLGLIVLDEEQKFGVEDKEKLKNKYPNVDVLTLSATPIPRTLNMSLTGIRDISVISTPPSERLPIQTYITEYTESLVRDAINRELARDGQVFILFNSVEKIYSFAESIRKIVPDATISVAHGQMPSKALENVIYDFYHRKSDILICTTIIENGVDIENANTLIVVDSDKLGLSQLYQIRGRVGRGSRMAYAYLTYKYEKILSEDAYKRLDAMNEFCEFGSGFKLAMRDLEIRGAGNILGAEQSGHLQKIGYDMYTRLLMEAIKELKGEEFDKKREVLVKVALDAYVPDTYVATSEDRMVAYKRISIVDSIESVEKLKIELVQNYGEIPKVVLNLIDIALVRQLASKIDGSVEICSIGAEVDLIFEKSENITKNEILAETIFKMKNQCSIDMTEKPSLKFMKNILCSENFNTLKKFLLKYFDVKQKINQNK